MTSTSKLILTGSFLLLSACGQDSSTPAADTASMPAAAPAATASCDRSCLIDLANNYVAALAAHEPSAVPLAADIAYVENVTRMQPGEGLWASTETAPDNFRVIVPDTQLQQVGLITTLIRRARNQDGVEESQNAVVGMRLKLNAQGQISEAEHLVSAVRPDFMVNLQTPRLGLLSEVPEANRLSHDELATIGMSYYDALDNNDGSAMPFADDCERHENGMVTAGPGPGNGGPFPNPDQVPVARTCAAQLDSQTFTYIDEINNRRLVAADPVTGLAMGLSHFRHPMDNLPYNVIHTDGSTSERNKDNMPFQPFDLPAAHIFKIGADGQVHEIEAMGFTAPLYSQTGWE